MMPVKEVVLLPSFAKLYELEIDINKNVQTHMRFAEPLLVEANTYLDPQIIMDWWIPLLGVFGHKLLARMVVSVGILNVISSVFKWTLPEYRPVWWIKEYNSSHHFQGFNIESNTCDTSAGFPSSHVVTFTAFTFVFFHSLISKLGSKCYLRVDEKYFITHALVSLPLCYLCCSRLYFLTEFLHQCIGGYLFAIAGLHSIHRKSSTVLRWNKLRTCCMVALFGSLTVCVYFVMLYLDVDPHWSVRMAFKWCSDPTLMRHESGPIFVLFRDFGYMLGVAMSCPLFHNYKNNKGSIYKRIPALLIVVFLNLAASQNTPKHLGRWVFLFYELGRSCAQAYTLLTIIPKIVK